MKSSVARLLIKIARAKLQHVIGQITQQLNLVQEEAEQRMQAHVSDVVGGMWTGQGADKFVASINEEAMPMISQILEGMSTTTNNINTALQIMDEADQNVRRAVDNLVDTFEKII